MNFTELIEKINSDKRLVPDLLKTENGNNFRAVSESAILDVVDPILKEAKWYYTVEVENYDLQIREAYGSKGKKLQFIATVKIKVNFWQEKTYVQSSNLFSVRPREEEFVVPASVSIESVGMGIDDNDKAMGKAYTYALKYALLKVFRLRYGDDPDYKKSEPLVVSEPKEAKKEEKKPVKKSTSEKLMTENQRDYILGLAKTKNVSIDDIEEAFHVNPKEDKDIAMTKAREIIKWLEDEDGMPF